MNNFFQNFFQSLKLAVANLRILDHCPVRNQSDCPIRNQPLHNEKGNTRFDPEDVLCLARNCPLTGCSTLAPSGRVLWCCCDVLQSTLMGERQWRPLDSTSRLKERGNRSSLTCKLPRGLCAAVEGILSRGHNTNS